MIGKDFTNDYKAERNSVSRQLAYYKASDRVKVLKPSKRCYFLRGNRFNECAREFILNGPFPSGSLSAISDVESFSGKYYSNNRWVQNFEIYVR